MSLTVQQTSGASLDPAWDAFLVSHPLGQFQQSGLWAAVKRLDGWQCVREMFREDGRIIGGFQLLFKSSRVGRIGYVSKGPVLIPEYAAAAPFILDRLRECVRDQHIGVLIVQPPDVCTVFPEWLGKPPFLKNRLVGVITANCVVELDKDFSLLKRRMRSHTLQEVRQAVKRGVVVREGGEADLDTFFQLMLASCARQQEGKPNPNRVELLKTLWNGFYPEGHLALHMAEVGGEVTAGLLSIAFGSRVTFWKKGWSGAHAHAHPNQLMQYAALRWAASEGYHICDFAAMNPDLARTLLAGQEPSTMHKQSRDFFNLGFGGVPVLLPPAKVFIPNPVLRIAYRAWAHW